MGRTDPNQTIQAQQTSFTTSTSSSKPQNTTESASETPKPKFKGKSPPPCICGSAHWHSDCYYLVPEKRPQGWKPNQDRQAKVDEAMKDTKTREFVNRNIKRTREFEATKSQGSALVSPSTSASVAASSSYQYGGTVSSSDNQATSIDQRGSFACTSTSSSFIATGFSLKHSWILDGGSNIHVCNSSMSDRFCKTRNAEHEDYLNAGERRVTVEAYGTVNITVQTPQGPKTIQLSEVAYAPGFMTNLVSESRLKKKGVYFDNYKMHLHDKGITLAKVDEQDGLYVLESNSASFDAATSNTSTKTAMSTCKKGTMQEWHEIMAHASTEAIKHMITATQGAVITDPTTTIRTNKCETCALSKSTEIISRSSDKSESSEEPFYRVTYDLMQFNPALNRDEWVSHFACSVTNFGIVVTHTHKGEATQVVQEVINMIETRWNKKVVFLHSDGEKSLGNEFNKFILDKGITWEPSAPSTPAQNGHAERQGRMLQTKARTMRIAAGLPEHLWHEIVRSAAYIANRTPIKKLGWKTPWEMVTGKKPDVSHLHKLGSKAYALDKHIDKKDKLQARAHIGYLVGYDSTNIFRVWIPSKRKIIRTRDVIFDENSTYTTYDADKYLLQEATVETYDYSPLRINNASEVQEEESDPEGLITYNWGSSQSEGAKGVSSYQYGGKGPVDATMQGALPSPPHTDTDSGTPAPIPDPPQDTRQRNAPRAGEIAAGFDADNILPEGAKRTRKRKDAYSATLDKVAHGSISSYNMAFFAFAAASNYYTDKQHHRDTVPPEPKNYKEMLNHSHSAHFRTAVNTEISQLEAKQTWIQVPREQAIKLGKTPIPTTWVFRYKVDEKGFVIKHKARLCARGDLQTTYQDTYAATLASRIFRALMAITAAFDLETRQYDAVNAFANSPIDEPVFCHVPEGWKQKTESEGNMLLMLKKALYGLKQSPALWYKHLSSTLVRLGLEPIPGIECTFINKYMIIFFFVDDISVIYEKTHTTMIDKFEADLFSTYEMKRIGELEWFLGIRITRNREERTMYLCQDSYISKLTTKFHISMEKGYPGTPIPGDLVKTEIKATPQDIHTYQQMVGSINFAAVITRPDIAYAASKLATFLTNPSKKHIECAIRVLRYLEYTKHYAIKYEMDSNQVRRTIFLASSDASFADDIETRKSSQGFVFKLFNGAIDWKASRQRSVTTSSTEAELHALSSTGKEVLWWNRFFEAIQFDPGHQISIQCDNAQTIRVLTTENAKFHTKLRHVDVHRHWLRQEVEKGIIKIEWTPTSMIIADGLTKALTKQKHERFVTLLGMHHGNDFHHDPMVAEAKQEP
jgi:hypothetical protein